jgi:glutaredoxin 2
MIDDLNASLVELDKLVHCHECCTEGGLSLDDIDLWSILRSVRKIITFEVSRYLSLEYILTDTNLFIY